MGDRLFIRANHAGIHQVIRQRLLAREGRLERRPEQKGQINRGGGRPQASTLVMSSPVEQVGV